MYSKAVLEALNLGGGMFALSTVIYTAYYTTEPTMAIDHLWSAVWATLGPNVAAFPTTIQAAYL